MSREARQKRQQKRLKIKRRKQLLLAIVSIFVIIFVFAGYYRSNQSQILEQEEYLNSISTQLFFLRDCDYMEIDDFSSDDLSVPEGTKVSGYDVLTKEEMIIDPDYLSQQLNGIHTLINNNVYDNWDQYSLDLQNELNSNSILSPKSLDYYKQTARYFPETREELEKDISQLNQLNTGNPVSLTLNRFGVMKTGFVYSYISEYDKVASEAALGHVSLEMINGINNLSTDDSSALRVINNDHCFVLTTVDIESPVQGENEVKELQADYKEGLSNSEYYNMLITRVDRLRLYPNISFSYNDRTYPAYLVDVIEEGNKKILVIMVKEYLKELAEYDRLNCEINTQDYRAWVVPQTAIIKRDDKNFIELVQKGYFVHEIEVNVNLYDKGKAILRVANNPDLEDGMTIKIYP